MAHLKLNNEKIDERIQGRNIIRIGDYVRATIKIQWKCNICGYGWEATPNNVINNHTGCRSCSQSMVANNPSVLARIHEKHIVPVDTIKTATSKTSWMCVTCNHIWSTTLTSLLDNGSGCPKCAGGGGRVSKEEVQFRLTNRSIKLMSEYTNMATNATWKCTTCQHEWTATPNNVLNANTRCPKCSKRYSVLENEWLDHVGVPALPGYRQVAIKIGNKRFRVDGYVPATNTVYEFWGDYWHGNPTKYPPGEINGISKKTFKELFDRTNTKRQLIMSAGYTLVEIWESEWNHMKHSTSC